MIETIVGSAKIRKAEPIELKPLLRLPVQKLRDSMVQIDTFRPPSTNALSVQVRWTLVG